MLWNHLPEDQHFWVCRSTAARTTTAADHYAIQNIVVMWKWAVELQSAARDPEDWPSWKVSVLGLVHICNTLCLNCIWAVFLKSLNLPSMPSMNFTMLTTQCIVHMWNSVVLKSVVQGYIKVSGSRLSFWFKPKYIVSHYLEEKIVGWCLGFQMSPVASFFQLSNAPENEARIRMLIIQQQ